MATTEVIGNCVSPFRRHSWSEDGRCIRDGCTAIRQVDAQQSSASPDSMNALEQEFSQPEKKPRGTAARKQKADEEKKLSQALARANARQIISRIEDAKKIAAQYLMGYHGSAFELEVQEMDGMVEQLTRYLELTGYAIDNPKVVLALLVLNELSITSRQMLQILREKQGAEQNSRGNRS